MLPSHESLAAKAGVHRTHVGRLERAESGVTVEALEAILGTAGDESSRVLQAVSGNPPGRMVTHWLPGRHGALYGVRSWIPV
jgi:hypothetical protein